MHERDPVGELRLVHESDFTSGSNGWSIEVRGKELGFESRGRQLCFTPETEGILLRRIGLDLDDRWLHLLWVELSTDSDLAVRIYWKSDAEGGFPHERSVAAMSFKGQIEEPLRRFYHLLPKGTRGVQLGIFPTRWEGSVCLDTLLLAQVIPAPVVG